MHDRKRLMSTDRLFFGLWQTDDTPLAEAIWGEPDVTALTGGPFTSAEVASRLATEIDNWQLHQIQYWPLFELNSGVLAGCCGLRPRSDDGRTAELGFQLCRAAWGQGYASEAATAVIAWAGAQEFEFLVAGHHPRNDASRRTLIRLGFSYTHHEFYVPTGEFEPCCSLKIFGGH